MGSKRAQAIEGGRELRASLFTASEAGTKPPPSSQVTCEMCGGFIVQWNVKTKEVKEGSVRSSSPQSRPEQGRPLPAR